MINSSTDKPILHEKSGCGNRFFTALEVCLGMC